MKKSQVVWLDEDLIEVRGAYGPVAARLIAAVKTERKVIRVMHVSASTYQVTLEPQ